MRKSILFYVTMLLMISGIRQYSSAQTNTGYAVTYSYSSQKFPRTVTFKIDRGATSHPDTIIYRTVSLTAIEGQHFDGVSGVIVFPTGTFSKTVDVNERALLDRDAAYRYHTGESFFYRFEVLDITGKCKNGKVMSITSGIDLTKRDGKQYSDFTYFYGVQRKQIAPDGHQFAEDIIVTDKGYSQNYSSFGPYTMYGSYEHREYFGASKAEILATLEFQAKETNDGYQHVQILVDNLDDCDKGDPDAINKARYMAKFEHGSGELNTEYANYVFPVASVGDNEGAELPWTDLDNNVGKLTLQRFNTGCRAEDGRLIIPANFKSGVVRYDASGNGADNWNVKKSYINLELVDRYAPEVLDIKVSQNAYRTGNELYVSIAFNEMVYTDDKPVLYTSWGALPYLMGKGTNVLAFGGKITDGVAGSQLEIESMSSPVRDILGHEMTLTPRAIPYAYKTDNANYTISYDLNGGSVETPNPTTYYGATPTFALNNPTKQGYTFIGWTGSNGEEPQTEVTIAQGSRGNRSYTANWIMNTYTVTWQNEDGTILETDEDVTYGSRPSYNGEMPAKAADAQYTYMFKGWDAELAPVTSDVTYTATYRATLNTYTISWLDDEDNLIDQTEVAYGVVPEHADAVKAATAQYTYTFAGWIPEIVAVTGDATYKATFDTTPIVPTTIDQSVVDTKVVKFFHNEHILILRGDKTYTVTGQEMR